MKPSKTIKTQPPATGKLKLGLRLDMPPKSAFSKPYHAAETATAAKKTLAADAAPVGAQSPPMASSPEPAPSPPPALSPPPAMAAADAPRPVSPTPPPAAAAKPDSPVAAGPPLSHQPPPLSSPVASKSPVQEREREREREAPPVQARVPALPSYPPTAPVPAPASPVMLPVTAAAPNAGGEAARYPTGPLAAVRPLAAQMPPSRGGPASVGIELVAGGRDVNGSLQIVVHHVVPGGPASKTGQVSPPPPSLPAALSLTHTLSRMH